MPAFLITVRNGLYSLYVENILYLIFGVAYKISVTAEGLPCGSRGPKLFKVI